MVNQYFHKGNLSFKDKILALDFSLIFLVLALGIISFFAMFSTEQGNFGYYTQNHLYRFSGSVNEGSVRKCMSKLTEWDRLDSKCKMEIVFSSPGGSIIDGFELFDFMQELRGKGHHLTTGSLGMAASMAGILLQAGDVRWIGHQSWMMIHRAAFGAIGKTYEVEDEVKLVKRIEDRCVDIFVSRSKLSKIKIKRNWDRKDWWIDADECLALGLVDEVRAIMPEHERLPLKERKKRSSTKKKKKK